MQVNRLDKGGRIDRSQPLKFRFNGKSYAGFAGDTLASALLANGVSLVNRSFKLHRPRGIVGSGAEEPNAIFQIGKGAHALPNRRATQVVLRDGLVARSTKGWPGIRFDIGAINDRFSKLFGAGFYYKTFMFPQSLWNLYEDIIRGSAGFGKAPNKPDPDRYEHKNAHCDVLIAGAGPAGLMAALAAARTGARVIVADEGSEPGGSLLRSDELINGNPASEWIESVLTELKEYEDVVVLPNSTVFGYFDQNFLTITERTDGRYRQREWRVRASQVVLAQGAIERPLVFCNNDRPGIMLASAVSEYVNRYAVRPGKRAVVFTNNDSAYQAAIDLHASRVTVAAIVDSRKEGAGEISAAAKQAGIPILQGHIVTNARGRKQVTGVKIAKWAGDPDVLAEDSIDIACDLVAMSGGWSPAVHLHSQSGARNAWDDALHCFVPGDASQECATAGAGSGLWSLPDCLAGRCPRGQFRGSTGRLHCNRRGYSGGICDRDERIAATMAGAGDDRSGPLSQAIHRFSE